MLMGVMQNRGRGDVDSRKSNPCVAISVGDISQSNNRGVGSQALHSSTDRGEDKLEFAAILSERFLRIWYPSGE